MAYSVVIPPSTGSFYLRLARQGNHWTESYSSDGATWSAGADFTWALSVQAVGVFAGNAGPSPAFTGIVDYFHDRSNPVVGPSVQSVAVSDSLLSMRMLGSMPSRCQWSSTRRWIRRWHGSELQSGCPGHAGQRLGQLVADQSGQRYVHADL